MGGWKEESRKVTWRDAVTAVLTLAAVMFALAATQGWSWPLLGSPRAAISVMGVVGYAMSMIGIQSSKLRTPGDMVRGPFMIAASALGAIALGLVIAGLIVSSEALVVALALNLLLLWLVATGRHAVEGTRLPDRLAGATEPPSHDRPHPDAATMHDRRGDARRVSP